MSAPRNRSVFNGTNPDFLFKNSDFLLKNVDFLLKNVAFIIKQAESHKHMPKRSDHFVYGYMNKWTLAPERGGAHNWEGALSWINETILLRENQDSER